MRVRTIQVINKAQGEIPVGKIITIPEHLAERLKGKVEPVADTYPFRGAVEIVTPEGARVWIATEPASVKLVPEGAVYFLGDEILQLKKVGKEAARSVLLVKQVFPGAIIDSAEVNSE